jgi:hypothetical protein
LRVRDAWGIPRGLLLAQKNRHELIHARVGEEEIGRIREKRGRGHDGVTLLLEEVQKRLADLGAGHDGHDLMSNIE